MKKTTLILSLACLTSCAAPASTVLAPASKPGSMSVKGAISLKSVRNFALKSLVTENDETTLARIEVWLSKDGATATSLGDLPGSARELTLNNLKLDADYTVTLKGFKDDPDTDGTDADLPISEDALSVVTFNTDPDTNGAYKSEQEVTFALKLADQSFAGQAAGNIDLAVGDLTSTDTAEALVAAEPPAGPVGLLGLASVSGTGTVTEAGEGRTLTLPFEGSHTFRTTRTTWFTTNPLAYSSVSLKVAFSNLPIGSRLTVAYGTPAQIATGDFSTLPRWRVANLAGGLGTQERSTDGTSALAPVPYGSAVTPLGSEGISVDFFHGPTQVMGPMTMPEAFGLSYISDSIGGGVNQGPIDSSFEAVNPDIAGLAIGFLFENLTGAPLAIGVSSVTGNDVP